MAAVRSISARSAGSVPRSSSAAGRSSVTRRAQRSMPSALLDGLLEAGRPARAPRRGARRRAGLQAGERPAASRRAARAPTGCARLGGLQAAPQAVGGDVARGRDRCRRAGRERCHQPLVLGAELGPVGEAVQCGQHAQALAAEPQRDDELGVRAERLQQERADPGRASRAAARGRCAARSRSANPPAGSRSSWERSTLPGGRAIRSSSPSRRARIITRASTSARERLTTSSRTRSSWVSPPALGRSLGRLERPDRPHQLVAPPAHAAVEARVGDRDRRPVRERDRRCSSGSSNSPRPACRSGTGCPTARRRSGPARPGRSPSAGARAGSRRTADDRRRPQPQRPGVMDQHAQHAVPARQIPELRGVSARRSPPS